MNYLDWSIEHAGEDLEHTLHDNAVSFDADGVLINSTPVLLSILNEHVGTMYNETDVDQWPFVKWLSVNQRISMNEARRLEEVLWSRSDLMLNALPVEGSGAFSRELHSRGITQHVITSRRPHLTNCTYEWFQKWMPWLNRSNIHIRDTMGVSGGQFKSDMIKTLEIGIHFEDDPVKAELILSNPDVIVILLPSSNAVSPFDDNRFSQSNRVFCAPDLWAVHKKLLHTK